MKNIIYVLLSVIFINSVSFAQTNSEIKTSKSEITIDTTEEYRKKLFNSGKVTFGLKAGYTHSNLYGSEIDYIFADNKADWLPGFHAGIFINSQLSKYFWLKHELIFSQRGAGITLSDSINGPFPSQLKTYYVDLYPINLCFHIKGLQIYSGPYISALTHASIQRKDINGNLFNDNSIFGDPGNREGDNENKYLQKFDFGVNAGIEYQFPFGVILGVKYNHGFTDIFQYANSYTNGDTKLDNIKIYNRSLLFSIGYTLVRNKKDR